MGTLSYDFFKSYISKKEIVTIYICAMLLGMLCIHICLNLYISYKLLMQVQVSKSLKSIESKIHLIVVMYFSFCFYLYLFERGKYAINSTFSVTIILAIIYYFLPIFLYIILRLIFFVVILILVFLKRKKPYAKKNIKKS